MTKQKRNLKVVQFDPYLKRKEEDPLLSDLIEKLKELKKSNDPGHSATIIGLILTFYEEMPGYTLLDELIRRLKALRKENAARRFGRIKIMIEEYYRELTILSKHNKKR